MTHDPLCSISQACAFDSRDGFHILYKARGGLIACDCCDRTCCCDVIAKVRADERKQAGQRVMSLPSGVSLSVAAAVASGDCDAAVGW